MDLSRELRKLLNIRGMVILIVIGAHWNSPKYFKIGLEEFEIGGRIETMLRRLAAPLTPMKDHQLKCKELIRIEIIIIIIITRLYVADYFQTIERMPWGNKSNRWPTVYSAALNKAYDMVKQTRIIQHLQMCKIYNNVIIFITKAMKKLVSEIIR